MMASLCEVCASEPFKYRCPTCGLMSCSLACTQTHKIYCSPKAPITETSKKVTDPQPHLHQVNKPVADEDSRATQDGHRPAAQEPSSQIKALLDQCPSLGDQLRDIYEATLQEQWAECAAHRDTARHLGRCRPSQRNRGPWTREKGFKRGLGKVRKFRERCEDGLETGNRAEGFMQLLALVNEGGDRKNPSDSLLTRT